MHYDDHWIVSVSYLDGDNRIPREAIKVDDWEYELIAVSPIV